MSSATDRQIHLPARQRGHRERNVGAADGLLKSRLWRYGAQQACPAPRYGLKQAAGVGRSMENDDSRRDRRVVYIGGELCVTPERSREGTK